MEVRNHPAGLRPRGFSLLELMVTITVLGILVAFAVPSFTYLSANTKMKTATSDLHLALLKARSEAVKRSAAVTITAVSGTDWAQGWTITAAGGVVLNTQESMPGVRITPTPSPLATLVFQSTGRAAATPTFDLVPAPRNRTEKVDVSLSRRINVQASGTPYIVPTEYVAQGQP